MADLHPRKCVSCGAPIQLGALKCEYCGMVYDTDYWAGTVKYVPLRMGKKRLAARAQIDDMLLKNNEAAANIVKRELVERIAEGLAEYMIIRMHYDPREMVTIVDGEVWVEDPNDREIW